MRGGLEGELEGGLVREGRASGGGLVREGRARGRARGRASEGGEG